MAVTTNAQSVQPSRNPGAQHAPSGDVPTQVAVVGAGIAGLVSAKVLLQDGFSVTVYEREETIGGVWAPSRTYPGLRTNNPRETYAFSDFPYPPGTSDFPTAEEVYAYLVAYADRFGLGPHLVLDREVVTVARIGQRAAGASRFRVTTRPASGDGGETAEDFDHVVICNGVFSKPAMPAFEGMDRFVGNVVHSSQFGNLPGLSGQRVVVIDAGKSALDCAAVAALAGADCTLVCRRPHWMLPRYMFGRVRMDRGFFTRLAEMFLPLHHTPARGEVKRT